MPHLLPPEDDATSRAAQPRAIAVLVATADAALTERVRAALDGERFELHFAPQPEDSAPPEVIVTDQTLASTLLASQQSGMIAGEIGVVLLGKSLPADVQLPLDFTRRELRLAVRMLAQIVALRRQQRRLLHLAETDSLTGLPNRRALAEQFRHLTAQPSDAPLALALFDLDQFKQVNADHGYLRGDDVLRGAAKTVAARAQPHFLARLGGDEFVLLWRAANESAALTFAEECRRALGTAASLKAERPITASAGLVLATSHCELESLLAAADAAVRRAKQAGGKRLECAAKD